MLNRTSFILDNSENCHGFIKFAAQTGYIFHPGVLRSVHFENFTVSNSLAGLIVA